MFVSKESDDTCMGGRKVNGKWRAFPADPLSL